MFDRSVVSRGDSYAPRHDGGAHSPNRCRPTDESPGVDRVADGRSRGRVHVAHASAQEPEPHGRDLHVGRLQRRDAVLRAFRVRARAQLLRSPGDTERAGNLELRSRPFRPHLSAVPPRHPPLRRRAVWLCGEIDVRARPAFGGPPSLVTIVGDPARIQRASLVAICRAVLVRVLPGTRDLHRAPAPEHSLGRCRPHPLRARCVCSRCAVHQDRSRRAALDEPRIGSPVAVHHAAHPSR